MATGSRRPSRGRHLGRGDRARPRYTYDDCQRLSTLESRSTAGALILGYRYGYDAVGNVRQIDDLRGASTMVGGVNTSEDQQLTYDDLDRLRTATTPVEGTRSYDYDPAGNITLKDGVTRTYSACGVGTLERCIVGRLGTVEQWRARHDVGGDRTAMELISTQERWDYEYDASGQLLWARLRSLGGGAVRVAAAFAYGVAGERVRKTYTTPTASTVTTTWLGGDYELRTTSRAAGVAQTVHYETPWGQRLASRTSGAMLPGQATVASLPPLATGNWKGDTQESIPAGWVFLHSNQLGSSSVLTDGSGAVLARTLYEPFGEINVNRSRGTDSTTMKFARMDLDEETGLSFSNARYYDPKTARFLTADTLTPGMGQSSQGWNRYAYSNNSPLTYVDPSGHIPKPVTAPWQGDWHFASPVAIATGLVDIAVGASNGILGTDVGSTFGNERAYGAGMMLGAVASLVFVDINMAVGGDVIAGGGLGASATGGGAVVGVPATAGGLAIASAGAALVTVHAGAFGRGLDHAINGSNNAMHEASETPPAQKPAETAPDSAKGRASNQFKGPDPQAEGPCRNTSAMRTLEVSLVFDWYDGLVLGLGSLSGDDIVCLVSLIAYDANSRKRAYALVPLHAADESALEKIRHESVDHIREELRALCGTRRGAVVVAVVDDSGMVATERLVDVDLMRHDLVIDVEDATATDRAHWLAFTGDT